MRQPKRGVHFGVDMDEYRAWDAISQSLLKRMSVSPRHYAKTPVESTPSSALRIGSLVHCATLEPDALSERYVVQPRFERDDENVTVGGTPTLSKVTKYYKRRVQEFREANIGRELVSQDEFDRTQAVVYSLAEDHRGRDLLSREGKTEVSLVWEDPLTGLPCKARIDKMFGSSILDVKTTRSLRDFPGQCAKLFYHVQAAHYITGLREVGGIDVDDAWILAVENDKPHCVHAAVLSREAINRGEELRRSWLRRVVECTALGEWPGPELPDVWELPDWAMVDDGPLTIKFGNEVMEV